MRTIKNAFKTNKEPYIFNNLRKTHLFYDTQTKFQTKDALLKNT
jgi:hypothetical protein